MLRTRRVTAARFVRFCQLDFTRLVSLPFLAFSLRLLLSPRHLGAAESTTLLSGGRAFNSTFNSTLRYVSPFLCREFLSRLRDNILEDGINANSDENVDINCAR